MYEVFDRLLKNWTWHTSHPLDVGRFDAVLEEVISLPDFDPEKMGTYMKENGVRLTLDTDKQIDQSIERMVDRARSMKRKYMH